MIYEIHVQVDNESHMDELTCVLKY